VSPWYTREASVSVAAEPLSDTLDTDRDTLSTLTANALADGV